MAFARSYNEGLGLDGGWGCEAPKRRRSVSRSRLAKDAQGMEAEWPRQLAGSVYDSPTGGCAKLSANRLNQAALFFGSSDGIDVNNRGREIGQTTVARMPNMVDLCFRKKVN